MTTSAHCPYCTASHKLTAKGRLARHGFKAHHVRHGANQGFHSGSCSGSGFLPIGTLLGNEKALENASLALTQASTLRGLAPLTEAEAREAIIVEAVVRARRNGREMTKEQAERDGERTRAFASYNIKAMIDGTQRRRAGQADDLDNLAAELSRLVQEA